VYRETSPTAYRKKVDGIEMNIKVSYRLAIFAIIIEILIFEIVLMKSRREKRSNRSKYSSAQFITFITLTADDALERQERKRAIAQRSASPFITSRCTTPRDSMVVTHNRDYKIMKQITIRIITLQK